MAITDITTSEEFIAGAPNIKLKGDLRPNQVAARDPEEGVMEFDEEVITPYDLQKEEGVNIGPMASAPDPMDEAFQMYKDAIKKGLFNGTFDDFLEKIDEMRDYDKTSAVPRMMASGTTWESPEELYKKAIQEGTFDGTFDQFSEELERLKSKFMASGGRVQYGLGSLVKSIGKTAKKVAKSPIGKAALLYAATAGIGNIMQPGAARWGGGLSPGGWLRPSTVLSNIGLGNLVPGASNVGSETIGGNIASAIKGNQGLLAGTGIGLASILAAADVDTSNPSEMPRSTEELQGLLRRGYKNLNPRADEVEIEEFVRVNSANGGRIGFAFGTPDTAQAAGIMGNLPVRQNKAGVNELDLRETGGFIPPVGVKEKADDVPAMVSNNEFVMTADAVRAAGGGSVNVGAQRMYDLMKNLESRIA